MTPTKVTRENFTTTLVRSTNPRGSVPNGNVYLDPLNGNIQLITYNELNQINLGSGLEDNPFTATTKMQSLALYFFILQEIEADSSLQNFRFSMDAVSNRMGKLVGATAFLNSIKLADGTVDISGMGGELGDDRLKICDSGFQEFAAGSGGNTLIDRVLHGAKTLKDGAINATSQPFYMLAASLSEADRQAATPIDFSKPGDVNEVIQTKGSTANGDTGAGDFDYTDNVLILGVRDYGYTIGEVNSVESGVPELGAYSQGYGLTNAYVNELSTVDEADVWGVGQTTAFAGLGFYRHATPQTKTGFVEADSDFTDEITNANGATLIQIRAWLDKLMQQDTDQNDNTGTTGSFIPKRAEPLYTINAQGKLVTRAGLYIAGVPAADSDGIIQTADNGDQKTNPRVTAITIFLSTAWFNDTAGWFRMMYLDGATNQDYHTATAVTVKDSSDIDIAGDKTDSRIVPVTGGYELRLAYAYDTNSQAGLNPSEEKQVVFSVGGTDNSTSKTFTFTISSSDYYLDAATDIQTN